MDAAFHAKLAAAQQWEAAFAAWLIAERGCHVLAATEYSKRGTHAPCLLGNPALIAPDLLVGQNGTSAWFEIKKKDRADWHRNSQRFVTGLPLRLWEQYAGVQAATGLDVNVIFIHCEEDAVVGGILAELEAAVSHQYKGINLYGEHMLYFKFEALRRWCTAQRVMQYMKEVQP